MKHFTSISPHPPLLPCTLYVFSMKHFTYFTPSTSVCVFYETSYLFHPSTFVLHSIFFEKEQYYMRQGFTAFISELVGSGTGN